ncbi:DUF305 domain-containing protein [Sphingomonas sabuli]|uniref:DUF305 domain-containing protein n=2 Tax=Sphingomonas sabuli TaxID=2764186 RepID=A0A7G9L5S2_9SPHN|nr:DUF305 domain-containing protein [Sphingomonas sabuli]
MLSACGSRDEPANNVAAGHDMNAMADSGPFADSEMKMDQAMTAAVGVNAADSWVRKMIEHHKGAIDMSRILLAQNVTGHVADMAQQTIDKQGAEVTALEKLVATGNPDAASAAPYKPAAMAMHSAMMAASGADISDTWIRKMLEHHKGAIAMSDIALANGARGAVRAQIEKTKAEQQKEIDHIEGMLSGQQLASEPTAPAVAPAAKEKAPAAKPAPAKAAPVKPKPAEPKAPTPTCLPEHRAAGHC